MLRFQSPVRLCTCAPLSCPRLATPPESLSSKAHTLTSPPLLPKAGRPPHRRQRYDPSRIYMLARRIATSVVLSVQLVFCAQRLLSRAKSVHNEDPIKESIAHLPANATGRATTDDIVRAERAPAQADESAARRVTHPEPRPQWRSNLAKVAECFQSSMRGGGALPPLATCAIEGKLGNPIAIRTHDWFFLNLLCPPACYNGIRPQAWPPPVESSIVAAPPGSSCRTTTSATGGERCSRFFPQGSIRPPPPPALLWG